MISVEEDDNWYSSDEDETGVSKKKLTDILKNISKTVSSQGIFFLIHFFIKILSDL